MNCRFIGRDQYYQECQYFRAHVVQEPHERFLSEIQYGTVELRKSSYVVQHSFIVQNSISHLNLELNKSYFLKSSLLRSLYPNQSWIDTEEKCQKLHCPKRSLLYNLNLDLPKAREWSLKSKQVLKFEEGTDTFSIAKVSVAPDFYFNKLIDFFEHACEKTSHCGQKLTKLLKWFIKVGVPRNYIRHKTFNYIFECMRGDLLDTEVVKKYITNWDLKLWLQCNGRPEILENLLYQLHRISSRSERRSLKCGLLDRCFLHTSFLYTGEVLKFLNAPHLSRSFSDLLHLEYLRGRIVCRSLLLADEKRSKRRRALLLHLFWTFTHKSSHRHASQESLRLVWNSVSDAFFSYNELYREFRGLFTSKIGDMYHFYSTSVDDYSEDFQPRKLKQHCRCAIRKQLWESERWLPHAIEQLGLPTQLQSYLKLEK